MAFCGRWTDHKLYWSYRDYVTPYIQRGFQVQALRLWRVALETIGLSYDEVFAGEYRKEPAWLSSGWHGFGEGRQ